MIFNTPEVRLLIRILAIIGALVIILLIVSILINHCGKTPAGKNGEPEPEEKKDVTLWNKTNGDEKIAYFNTDGLSNDGWLRPGTCFVHPG